MIRPLRILMSGCLAGRPCGVDGTSYGSWQQLDFLRRNHLVELISFCPEEVAFGTPREFCNIHGGNGHDVLAGTAQVLTESGVDWTEPLIKAAYLMLKKAQEHRVDLAILMDISAACGSQVIYEGHRTQPQVRYQKGPGVCAALLLQNGIRVICQRDFRQLELLRLELDPQHKIDRAARDHHETEWYRQYFGYTS